MRYVEIARLVKSEDLNHHGTLYAGRMSEWFVESCFIAAAELTHRPESVVCLKIHGMMFKVPGQKGDILKQLSKVVGVGKSSITVYGQVKRQKDGAVLVDGFITFVNVDEKGKPVPHNLELTPPEDREEEALRKAAANLKKDQ